jgi:hypothetical protein
MKFRISVLSIILVSAVLLPLTTGIPPASAQAPRPKVYVAEPYLVQQPSYAGMTFYVYRPYGIENGWCLTFDGYAVTQTNGKVWVYGELKSGKLTPTGYVVGSVNPALAGIVPYADANSTYTSWRTDGRIVGQPAVANPRPQCTGRAGVAERRMRGSDVGTPFEKGAGAGAAIVQDAQVPRSAGRAGAALDLNKIAKQVYVPDWSVNPMFLAVSNWKSTVDRLGIIHKHNLPIAWKGDSPAVMYVWMGKSWKQIETRGEDVSKAININLYGLLREREKNRAYRIYADDVALLTEKTIGWGYLWMGEIFVRN